MSRGKPRVGGDPAAEKKQNSATKQRDAKKAALVKKAIQAFENKLKASEVKATVGDFVRLLQLQDEIEGEEPREIKVTWVEPGETESSSET